MSEGGAGSDKGRGHLPASFDLQATFRKHNLTQLASVEERQANREKDTEAVFEIVPYSLTHYSLYSVKDIVHYIGNEQTKILHF